MIIKTDFKKRTISLCEDAKLGDVLNFIKREFPDSDTTECILKAGCSFQITDTTNKKTESNPDEESVVVLLGGKKVRIDLHNLRDSKRAKRNERGRLEEGEHYFEYDVAQEAAKAVGKRLMTHEEQECMANLPFRWDADRKGGWFKFDTPQGTTVDIFFPASAGRSTNGAMSYVGQYGEYWSSSPGDASFGCILYFGDGYVHWGYRRRQVGLPVRCVVDV